MYLKKLLISILLLVTTPSFAEESIKVFPINLALTCGKVDTLLKVWQDQGGEKIILIADVSETDRHPPGQLIITQNFNNKLYTIFIKPEGLEDNMCIVISGPNLEYLGKQWK